MLDISHTEISAVTVGQCMTILYILVVRTVDSTGVDEDRVVGYVVTADSNSLTMVVVTGTADELLVIAAVVDVVVAAVVVVCVVVVIVLVVVTGVVVVVMLVVVVGVVVLVVVVDRSVTVKQNMTLHCVSPVNIINNNQCALLCAADLHLSLHVRVFVTRYKL